MGMSWEADRMPEAETDAVNKSVVEPRTGLMRIFTNGPVLVGFTILLLAPLAFVGAASVNYITRIPQQHDDGIFTAAAVHLLNGKTLYTEVFEHKPPMVFLVNAAALWLGDGTVNSVRQGQRFFAALGTAGIALSIYFLYGRRLLMVVFGVLFLVVFYNPKLYHLGNYTEEYGAIFTIGGVLFAVLSKKFTDARRLIWCALAGFSFSFAVLSKEPFVLCSLPWFFFVLIRRDLGWKKSFAGGAVFALCAILPGLLFLVYLVTHGALMAWYDSLFINFGYIDKRTKHLASEAIWVRLWKNLPSVSGFVFNVSWTTKWLAVAGMVSALYPPFLRKCHGAPWAILAMCLLDFFATQLLGPIGGHYCLQLVPSFILLSATGAAFLLFLFRNWRSIQVALVLAAAVCLWRMDYEPLAAYAERVQKPVSDARMDVVSYTVRQNKRPGDTLYVSSSSHTSYYTETGLVSPAAMFYPHWDYLLDTPVRTGEDRRAALIRQLEERPPTFLIRCKDSEASIKGTAFPKWAQENYRYTGISAGTGRYVARLFIRKDAAQANALKLPPNLLANGNFKQWNMDKTVPLGFSLLSGSKSAIQPALGANQEPQGLIQTWTGDDQGEAFRNRLSGYVPTMQPDTIYHFSVVGKNFSENTVHMAVCYVNGYDTPEMRFAVLSSCLLKLEPGKDMQEVDSEFQTVAGRDDPMALVSFIGTPVKFPGKVLWQEWKLYKNDYPHQAEH